MFKKKILVAALAVASVGSAFAGEYIVYNSPGRANPYYATFFATETGPIAAYYAGGTATFTETLSVGNATQGPLAYGPNLSNKVLTIGQKLDFGVSAVIGDVIFLRLAIAEENRVAPSEHVPSTTFNNPIYATKYTGDATIPSGLLVAWEDSGGKPYVPPKPPLFAGFRPSLPTGANPFLGAKWNYNDSLYVFPTLRATYSE